MTMANIVNLSVLLIPGFWLWMAVRLSDGLPTFGDEKQGRSLVIRIASVVLMVFGVVGVIASVFNPFGLIIAPIALVSLLIVLIVRRRSTQEKFLWALSFANDQGIEVSQVARLVASHVGKSGTKLNHLATLLEQGVPILESLKKVDIRLSPAVQLSIASSSLGAKDSGTLRTTIEAEERYRQVVRNSTESAIYLLGTSLFTFGIAVFLQLQVFPMFRDLTEYNGSTSATIDRVVSWERAFYLDGVTGVIIFLLLLAVLASLVFIYMDILPGNLWPISRTHVRFNRATVLATISRGLQNGHTPTTIAQLINQSHPYEQYRNEATRLNEDLLRGESLEKSLFVEGMISNDDQQRLILARGSDRLAEEIGWISQQDLLRAEMGWRIISSWLLPLGLIFIGLGVSILAWTVIESLNELIRMLM
jgi:type II secretory pathway component PulF